MCPACMLAYKRINKEKGLIMTPNSSMGIKRIFIGIGTPGIQKMCAQQFLLAVKLVNKKVFGVAFLALYINYVYTNQAMIVDVLMSSIS